MTINDKKQFNDPNIVKIIHNQKNVLYTSRSPIPYCKEFNSKIKAKRIYGIFAFRYGFKKFNSTKEFLEKASRVTQIGYAIIMRAIYC